MRWPLIPLPVAVVVACGAPAPPASPEASPPPPASPEAGPPAAASPEEAPGPAAAGSAPATAGGDCGSTGARCWDAAGDAATKANMALNGMAEGSYDDLVKETKEQLDAACKAGHECACFVLKEGDCPEASDACAGEPACSDERFGTLGVNE